MTVFLAEGLTVGEKEPMEDERIEMEWYGKDELSQMIRRGEILDGKTMIGYFLWLEHLKEKKLVASTQS